MPTWAKRLLLWGGVGLASLFFLILMVGAWLYFAFPADWVGKKISAEGSKWSGYQLTVGPVRPFPLGSFSIGEMRLATASGSPLFSLKQLAVLYRVGPLLKGELFVDRILIDEPVFTVQKESGNWNFERLLKLFPPPTESPPPSPFSDLDFENIPLDEIVPQLQRRLKERNQALPVVELTSLQIRNLGIKFDDGTGSSFVSPPMNLDLTVTLTPEQQKGAFLFEIPKGATTHLRFPQFEEAEKIPTSARFQVEGDLAKGNLTIEKANLSLPGWMEGHLSAKIEKFGLELFSAKGDLHLDPSKKLQPLPEVDASFDLKGKLKARTLAQIKRNLAHFSPPLELSMKANVNATKLPQVILPEGVQLQEAKGSIDLQATPENLFSRTSLNLSNVRLSPSMTGGTPLPALQIRHQGEINMAELKRIEIKSFGLGIPSLGFTCDLQGEIRSSLPFPELEKKVSASPLPVKILRESLSADLRGKLSMNAQKIGTSVQGISLQGLFQGGFDVRKSESDRMDVRLTAKGERFSAAIKDGLQLHALTMDVPIQKTFGLGPGQKTKRSKDASIWTRSYIENLHPLSPYIDTIQIDRLQTAGQTLENLKIDFGYDGTNFILDRLSANLLGGSLWGRFTVLPAENKLVISTALEAVDLDVNRLTKQKAEGDARISADTRAQLAIRQLQGDQKLSAEGLLDELEATFHLTKIGDQTLDRLILFLDPKGENPSLVQARALLHQQTVASAVKNPEVSFSISHGMMNADFALPSVKAIDLKIPIRGISVKNLLTLGEVRKSIEGFIPLLELARYLELQGIDDRGNLVFSSGSSTLAEVKP